MKTHSKRHYAFTTALTALLAWSAWAQTYDAYYRFRGEYPDDAAPTSHNDPFSVASDGGYWYIQQSPWAEDNASRLWKIPIGLDLEDEVQNGVAGVNGFRRTDFPGLVSLGCTQWFQPIYYKHAGVGYLMMILELDGGNSNAIGFFKTSDMSFIAHCSLSNDTVIPVKECAGGRQWPDWWLCTHAAVDPDGYLYIVHKNTMRKYSLTWNELESQGTMAATYLEEITLLNPDGSPFDDWQYREHERLGYVTRFPTFSETGGFLYLVADSNCQPGGCSWYSICVFDTCSWREIRRSSEVLGHLFYFKINEVWHYWEYPAGVAVVDLDDGRAPGIWGGQLHVFYSDFDELSANDLFCMHYDGRIYVDAANTGSESGTRQAPFNTVTEAHNLAWDGTWLKIQAGYYPESVVLSNQVRVVSEGGDAVIGAPAP